MIKAKDAIAVASEGWTHLATHRYIETATGGDRPQEEWEW